MDLTRDEENEYSSIEYNYLVVKQKPTNLIPKRSSEGNTYEEPSSAIKKREQKMFEPGETLPLVKKEAKKRQKSRESTICSIKCGLLILFILLTCALALLSSFQYLKIEKLQTNDSNSTQVVEEQERTINDQKKKMELQAAEISKLTNNASILMDMINSQKKTISGKETVIVSRDVDINRLKDKINEQKMNISEKQATINRHVADISQLKNKASALSQKVNEQKREINQKDEEIKKLGDNSAALLKKTNDDAKTIAEQNKVIDRHVADIREARNNASGLSHEIKRLRDEITEKDSHITKLKDNSTALQRKIDEQERTINDQEKKIELQAADINKLTNNASILMDTITSQKKILSEKKAVIVSRDADINQLINKFNELAPEHTSVMLLGGEHGVVTNSTIIYNSMEKSWRNCKLTLPSTLKDHGAAIINNEIYIFGGYDGTYKILNSLYKLGAGNKWERMADMNEKREYISKSSVVFNSEIWVIGGWDGRNALKSVEKYNPKTNNWTKMPELNESRASAAATVVDGKIYVSGGWDGWKIKNSVEVYDPEKGKWEIFNSSMPYGVYSHILIGNNSHLIVIGGYSSPQPTTRVCKIDVLNPKRNWEDMPFLRQGRYASGAAIIADELMVFGGRNNNSATIDSVEIFDGVEWKNGANLPDKRERFASIPLTWAQERLFLKRYCQNS